MMFDRFPVRPAVGALLLVTAFPVLAQNPMPPASPSLVPQSKPAVLVPKPVPPAAAPVVLPVKALPGAAVPVAGKLVPTRPDVATGKLDIDRTGLPATDLQGEKGRRLGVPEGRPGQMGVLGDGSKAGIDRDGLIGNNVITGGRYGDTYGAERINSKHRGDTRDFAGGEGGQAALGPGPGKVGFPSDVSKIPDGPVPWPVGYPDVGGNPPAKESAPAVSKGDAVGAPGGVASGTVMGTTTNQSGPRVVIAPVPGLTTKREREDATGGGSGAPVGRSDVVNAQRAIGARTGSAGGAGDDRGDANASGGGSGGPMRTQGTAGAAEREDKRGATLSMEEALRINTQINPVRH